VIDSIGRPLQSDIGLIGRPIPAPRQDRCQNKVGTWGQPSDEGGHMVGRALGGYGGRANLVPQDRVLNRGLWKNMEYEVGRCASAGYITTYTVLNRYPYFSSTVRPSKFFVLVGVGEEKCFGIFCFPVVFYRDSITIPNEVPTSDTALGVTGFNLGLLEACSR
jgi:hypothetical protein